MGTRQKGISQLVPYTLIRVHEDNLTLQIYIKDIKSSNGTFINGETLIQTI